jgi:adenosylmethionine-8-amino-7-oxononanoate aminotransferase
MWAVQFTSADGEAVGQSLRRRGLIVRGMVDRIMISPPLVITAPEVDELASIVATEIASL